MPSPLPLKSLNHIARLTRRLEQSKTFYCDVLGFQEVPRPTFDFPGAWLSNYGLMIHLIHSDSVAEPDEEIRPRDNHLALHSEDLEAVERLLAEHGVKFRKNMIEDGGIRQIFFRDPDGHHIEVGKYPPTPPAV